MLKADPLRRAFDEHTRRRAAGRPTPTVLVGPEVLSEWAAAQTESATGFVRCDTAHADDAVASYLADPFVRVELMTRLEARVSAARALAHDRAKLERKTAAE